MNAWTGFTARLIIWVTAQQPNEIENHEDYYTKLVGLANIAYPTLATEKHKRACVA